MGAPRGAVEATEERQPESIFSERQGRSRGDYGRGGRQQRQRRSPRRPGGNGHAIEQHQRGHFGLAPAFGRRRVARPQRQRRRQNRTAVRDQRRDRRSQRQRRRQFRPADHHRRRGEAWTVARTRRRRRPTHHHQQRQRRSHAAKKLTWRRHGAPLLIFCGTFLRSSSLYITVNKLAPQIARGLQSAFIPPFFVLSAPYTFAGTLPLRTRN